MAKASGTYRLDVTANTPGSYHFAVVDVDSGPAVPFDTQVAGHLDSAQQDQLFHFAGTAGQRLTFGHAPDPAHPFNGQWTLYGPDGAEVSHDDYVFFGGSDFLATLPSTGNYVLGLSWSNLTAPADFKFEIYTPAVNTQTVSVDGSTITGTLVDPGQQDIYTFNATAGQRIVVDSLGAPGGGVATIAFSVTGPAGSITNTTSLGDVLFVAPVSGTYRVTLPLTKGATGGYAFRLLDADQAPAVVLNQPTTVQIGSFESTGVHAVGAGGRAVSLQPRLVHRRYLPDRLGPLRY